MEDTNGRLDNVKEAAIDELFIPAGTVSMSFARQFFTTDTNCL